MVCFASLKSPFEVSMLIVSIYASSEHHETYHLPLWFGYYQT